MAFRLRPQESVDRGLRRLATKALRSAREGLRQATPPGNEAIHDARKSVKKVRAIVALIDADEGRGLGGCRKRMRRVSRSLSPLRDADAMLRMLTKLEQKDPRVFDEHTVARVRRRLSSHKQASMDAASKQGVWEIVDRELRKLRRRAKRWHPGHRGFRALAPGLRAAYRRGRKAMARALRRQRSDDFHEWRKHIKTLWYQLRLFEGSSPGLRTDIGALHRVESWLGDDHNVVVLCRELSKDVSLCDLERVRRSADRYQRELRRKALATTKHLYARPPGDYLRRAKKAWKAWRRHDEAQRRVQPPRRTAA